MAADLQALRAMLDVIDWQAQKYPSIGRTVTLLRDAIEEILTDAARDWGYAVVAGSSQGTSTLKQPVVSLENRNGRLSAVVRFIGFEQVLPESDDLPASIVAYFGAPPASVHIIEPSGNYGDAAEWFGRAGSTVEREVCYPTKV